MKPNILIKYHPLIHEISIDDGTKNYAAQSYDLEFSQEPYNTVTIKLYNIPELNKINIEKYLGLSISEKLFGSPKRTFLFKNCYCIWVNYEDSSILLKSWDEVKYYD